MSRHELRATWSLASLFALRMLGLFLILPVFAVHAPQLRGGENYTLIGIALGVYGLTQALMHIPFGAASDRYGRKRVIVLGLGLFALGSLVAALASDIHLVILGRALQGAGAISAAVVALLADLTRDTQRTKAMAAIGASIGTTFAVSLAAAPALYGLIGMAGIFGLTGLLALAGMAMTLLGVPVEPRRKAEGPHAEMFAGLFTVLRDKELLRHNFGIFALHAMQMALFVVLPAALIEQAALPLEAHWKLYLPVVVLSFAVMAPLIIAAERRQKVKELFLLSVALLAIVHAGLLAAPANLAGIAVALLGFFIAFNILEASLPSLVTRIAPVPVRGTAIGVYHTAQALGLFAGGLIGGALAQHLGRSAVFVFALAVIALWLIVAMPMQPPRARHGVKQTSMNET